MVSCLECRNENRVYSGGRTRVETLRPAAAYSGPWNPTFRPRLLLDYGLPLPRPLRVSLYLLASLSYAPNVSSSLQLPNTLVRTSYQLLMIWCVNSQ